MWSWHFHQQLKSIFNLQTFSEGEEGPPVDPVRTIVLIGTWVTKGGTEAERRTLQDKSRLRRQGRHTASPAQKPPVVQISQATVLLYDELLCSTDSFKSAVLLVWKYELMVWTRDHIFGLTHSSLSLLCSFRSVCCLVLHRWRRRLLCEGFI